MNERRRTELRNRARLIIAQEARALADRADFDQLTKNDEEDEFLRAELRRQGDALDNTGYFEGP